MKLLRTKALLRVLPTIVTNPNQIRYFNTWRRTYWNTALVDQKPWITFSARSWLDGIVRPNMAVFEYGSGGSTLYFANRAHSVVSIEHDPDWYVLVQNQLAKCKYQNTEHIICPPDTAGDPSQSTVKCTYESCRFETPGVSFRSYVQMIDRYEDESFDIVLIDGRARVACAVHALSKIRKGGYLVLDNSERDDYRPIHDLLRNYRQVEFGGLCPYDCASWLTTVWSIGEQQ